MPVSALHGDNIITKSDNMPWYDGPALLNHLETIEIGNGGGAALRLPVQYVVSQARISAATRGGLRPASCIGVRR